MKSWAETERLLRRAEQEVDGAPDSEEILAEYRDFLSYNELELAMEALANLENPPRSPAFWKALRDAAFNMGLGARGRELSQKFSETHERIRKQNLSTKDQEAFDPDGSLRDIYIRGVGVSEWQRLLDHVAIRYEVEFTWDGEVDTLPPAEEIFTRKATHAPTLKILVGDLTLKSHFFGEGEIELDLNPEDVWEQGHVDAVLGFLTEVSSLLERETILTFQAAADVPVYVARPGQSSPEYVPPPDSSA